MKNYTILAFILILFSSSISIACPYQSMAEIDKRLESSTTNLSDEKLSRITELRSQGEFFLKSGNVDKSEEILNNALALFKQ
tara:strand:+ start:95 stop:340 length:246 start_codon:yes stop_codon:yes gene_type:complete